MNRILGGVLVGVLIGGPIVAAIVPTLPASIRRPWVAWSIVAVSIAASVYFFRRRARTLPGHPKR